MSTLRSTSHDGSAELRAWVIERVRHEPAPTRSEVARARHTGTVAALVVSAVTFMAAGGIRPGPRAPELVIATALGALVVATAAAVVGLGRGRSMLGRPRAHLVALAVLTPCVLFAWKVLVTTRHPEASLEWPGRPGFRCLSLGAALSLIGAVALHWMRRGSDPVHPRAAAAALGTIAGAAAWVLVDLWCPVGHVRHLLLGHVLPLVSTVAASAVFGARFLTMRARATSTSAKQLVASRGRATSAVRENGSNDVHRLRGT